MLTQENRLTRWSECTSLWSEVAAMLEKSRNVWPDNDRLYACYASRTHCQLSDGYAHCAAYVGLFWRCECDMGVISDVFLCG